MCSQALHFHVPRINVYRSWPQIRQLALSWLHRIDCKQIIPCISKPSWHGWRKESYKSPMDSFLCLSALESLMVLICHKIMADFQGSVSGMWRGAMKAEDRWIVSLWQHKSLKVKNNLFPKFTKTIAPHHPAPTTPSYQHSLYTSLVLQRELKPENAMRNRRTSGCRTLGVINWTQLIL